MPTRFPTADPSAGAPGTCHVAVLLGGPSDERDVSLKSGTAVSDALRGLGHHVVEVDPKTVDVATVDLGGVDCVFIALHGRFGEDGQVQAALGSRSIPYTGSGPAASRLAMNKLASKQVFVQHGVPTPAFAVCRQHDSLVSVYAKVQEIGLPVVIKPVANGSSLGISIVETLAEVPEALAACYTYEDTALVEQCVIGRELTVGVLADLPLPIIEIKTPRRFYDKNAKYTDGRTEYLFDLGLSKETCAEVQGLAMTVHRALGCRDFSRVDIMLDRDERPMVLEANTIPGLTDHSLLPKAAAASGLSFGMLCETMVRLAIERCRQEGPARERKTA